MSFLLIGQKLFVSVYFNLMNDELSALDIRVLLMVTVDTVLNEE